jgi:hypothetical protein
LAYWIAKLPTPPDPAWIRTLSFSLMPTLSNACIEVNPTNGNPAASSNELFVAF